MRQKPFAGIGAMGLFACGLALSVSGCCGDCVTTTEFERRMGRITQSGKEIERWADEAQTFMMEVQAILARLDPGGDPPNPPDPPACEEEPCPWGLE